MKQLVMTRRHKILFSAIRSAKAGLVPGSAADRIACDELVRHGMVVRDKDAYRVAAPPPDTAEAAPAMQAAE